MYHKYKDRISFIIYSEYKSSHVFSSLMKFEQISHSEANTWTTENNQTKSTETIEYA